MVLHVQASCWAGASTCMLARSRRVWELATGRLVHTLSGHTGAPCNVFGVCASPAPASTVCVSTGMDRTVRVWDFGAGRCTHVFTAASDDWWVAHVCVCVCACACLCVSCTCVQLCVRVVFPKGGVRRGLLGQRTGCGFWLEDAQWPCPARASWRLCSRCLKLAGGAQVLDRRCLTWSQPLNHI